MFKKSKEFNLARSEGFKKPGVEGDGASGCFAITSFRIVRKSTRRDESFSRWTRPVRTARPSARGALRLATPSLYSNVRSILNKFLEFQIYVYERKPDIICLCETFIGPDITNAQLALDGYQCIV